MQLLILARGVLQMNMQVSPQSRWVTKVAAPACVCNRVGKWFNSLPQWKKKKTKCHLIKKLIQMSSNTVVAINHAGRCRFTMVQPREVLLLKNRKSIKISTRSKTIFLISNIEKKSLFLVSPTFKMQFGFPSKFSCVVSFWGYYVGFHWALFGPPQDSSRT